MAELFDLIVIGGGVNGAGIARDAAGRGLKVYLCEKDDLGSGTSSASSKLIHGGLRYLEYHEFRLVRESLREREVLLQNAPHIIWPLRFVLPHNKGQRPIWMIRAGLFLYDHLARRKTLLGSKKVNLHKHKVGIPLKKEYKTAFLYSDCWVQDARLAVLSAMDAQKLGAVIETRTECTHAARTDDGWEVTVSNKDGEKKIFAKGLVNASGPWVTELLDNRIAINNKNGLRLVKGSHIVTKKLFEHDHAYIFQNHDGRIVFAIPYENDYTLVGTTDVDYRGDPKDVAIDASERQYIIDLANNYFEKQITLDDIVWEYSGVRPLFDDMADNASAATRDYVFDLQDVNDKAPLLSIFGGKITTFRKLAEHAVDKIAPFYPGITDAWTKTKPLPGGGFENFDTFLAQKQQHYNWADKEMVHRLCREYGTNIDFILGDKNSMADLGKHFGYTFYAAEADYMMQHEFAMTAKDMLWRRTKIGLHLTEAERTSFEAWLTQDTVDA